VQQSFFKDFGICLGWCTTQKGNGNALGIVKPSSKPGRQDELIQGLLATCSNILRALGLPIFDFDNKRLQTFAGNLAKGNTIEAIRLAIMDEKNLCGVHEDQQNDGEFPSVPLFLKFIILDGKKYRVSIIMYSRQSISDYLKQKNSTYGPTITFVLDTFSQIPAERKYVLPGSFLKPELKSIDCHGLACSNLPMSHGPVIFCVACHPLWPHAHLPPSA
jgi:hypothetical protein